MDNLLFFQTLTEQMRYACNYTSEDYRFFYLYQNRPLPLKAKGKKTVCLSDSLGVWKVEKDGLSFRKEISFIEPWALKGERGVACEDAELGVCILWTCKSSMQTGCILPNEDNGIRGQSRQDFTFDMTFKAGSIKGGLTLDVVLYIKKKADEALPGEENLVNETGVTVGYLERLALDFRDDYMEFPIRECDEADKPLLWWLEIYWNINEDDPKTDVMFSYDAFCLFLNKHYPSCPSISEDEEGGILNFDMMVDILAQTYFLLFANLDGEDVRAVEENSSAIETGTVCYELARFLAKCEDFNLHRPEECLKGLQINIRRMLLQEES